MGRTYSIRELTRELSVTARTLRHYEAEGLIAPARNGQQRIYSSRDRARITLILRGRRVGFSLAEIGEMLGVFSNRDADKAQLLHARQMFTERVETLARQKRDIEESIAELKLGLTMIENKLAEPPPQPMLTVFGVMPLETEIL